MAGGEASTEQHRDDAGGVGPSVALQERGLEAGEAEVIGAGGPLSVALGPGDTFGEIGLLLTAGKRTATVVAQTPMKLLALSEPDFERIQGQIPEFERSLRSLGLERSSR